MMWHHVIGVVGDVEVEVVDVEVDVVTGAAVVVVVGVVGLVWPSLSGVVAIDGEAVEAVGVVVVNGGEVIS